MRGSVVAIVVLLGMSIASGCAQMLSVTFRSDPPLATIYQGSQQMGVTPVELRYRLTDDHLKTGRATFQGVSARWISGATADISALNVDLANGRNQQYTFFRPQSYPGLELDIQYVSNFRRDLINIAPLLLLQEQQQQQQQRPIVPPYTPPPTYNTDCTRDYLGNVSCTTRQQ